MLKPLTVWIITNCEKLLERQKYQDILSVSWETCMQVKSNRTGTGQFSFQSQRRAVPKNIQTTGKTIALTRWIIVGKVMSLLFNMLSRLVITFLPRNKRLFISWLQSPSAVILKPKNWNRGRWFSGIPMISLWSSECWQFDLWFLCLF